MQHGIGLTPEQIANGFSFAQIKVLREIAERKARSSPAADPTELRPGEEVISPAQLQAIIERRKARAAANPA
jgi:hypothetical protein